MTLAFSLDRTIEIHARRSTVFRFFTDAARWARWWGAGSTIDPVVGGAAVIVYPGGERISGVVRELVADQRLVFTYGYEAAGRSIVPGGSLVTITLDELPGGATRLQLRHDVDTAATRDAHVPGWRHQLARFAEVVGEDAQAGAGDAVAAWFTSWNEADADLPIDNPATGHVERTATGAPQVLRTIVADTGQFSGACTWSAGGGGYAFDLGFLGTARPFRMFRGGGVAP